MVIDMDDTDISIVKLSELVSLSYNSSIAFVSVLSQAASVATHIAAIITMAIADIINLYLRFISFLPAIKSILIL